MRNLDLNLGRRCNLQCAFCLDGTTVAKQRRWVPLDRAVAELERERERGCTALGLLGGEPTVYPHLFAVLARARALGYERIALDTNGLRLGDPALCDRLVAAGVTRVGVSLHGHTPALEDRLVGLEGAFARKLAGLERLVEHRRRGALPHGVAVNPVLCRPNHRHLVAYLRRVAAVGVEDVRWNFIRPAGRAAGSKALTPRFREAVPYVVAAIVENERRWGLHLSFGDFPLCVWPAELHANPALRARVVGERHDLETIVAVFGAPAAADAELERFDWSAWRQETLKVRVPACGECGLARRCEGVFGGYVALYGDEELRPLAARRGRGRP